MSYFISIKTAFRNDNERNIDHLNSVYKDYPNLLKMINGLFDDFNNKADIPGNKVLLKPNWVTHNKVEKDSLCLRTHDNFTLAVIEAVMQRNPREIVIGDAPIQSGQWDKIVPEPFLKKIGLLSRQYNIPVVVKDFRRITFSPSKNIRANERRALSEYVIFDLGRKSHLEEISQGSRNIFRVTDYPSDKMREFHRAGVHKYLIAKELFDCDLVISIPKAKTHQKAGITNSLKNIVGLNGDKAYLPHHRYGGVKNGGDCYPGGNILLLWAERALDIANKYQGGAFYKYWKLLAYRLWRLSFPSKKQNLSAGWYGNDTTWRMVLDLNIIIEYGCKDGTISDETQRKLLTITDGIIGGQGNGPLVPDPLPLGILSSSNNFALSDIALSYLMGFDLNKIPLLKFSSKKLENKVIRVTINDEEINLNDLIGYSIKTMPPPGWIDYL
jgi:uncharacterized protein (DUF362 family)